ncbi:hypothetical protein BGZ83_007978 [Gryganskiella cystojenkinii]|nr:hypothetical protein BGZ83_007978 [Gryganskiella cystojenkinii]
MATTASNLSLKPMPLQQQHQHQQQQPQQQKQTATATVPFLTPLGIDSQDVPWLADLVSRQAVRLFDPRQLQELVPSVTTGPTCVLHTAKIPLHTSQQQQPQAVVNVAIKQYHRPADLIFEVHQLLITPPSQYTNPLLGLVQLGDQGLTCLVVPHHPLGNLRQYIKDQRTNLNALQQLQIVHDITSGLEFLHQRGLQHMNLHSANVLVSLQGLSLLTDFGRPNNRAEVGMPPKPTAEWERIRSLAVVFLAPEVLASNSYSNRSEVYALGMVMFELLTGRVAFEKDLNLPGLSTRVMFGRQDTIPPNIKGSPGLEYETLIKDCWKLSPSDRPHLSEVKTRLEKLMAEWRVKMQQQQLLLLQQQQRYQQQRQAQYMQPYQPGSAAPPTPPLPEMPSVEKSLAATVASSRFSNSTASSHLANQNGASGEASTIVTTHIVVPAAKSDTSSKAEHDAEQDKSALKPVETWTIGLASVPLQIQQRDAIPVTTRTLDTSSLQHKIKTVSPDDKLFTIPLNTAPVAPAPVVASTVVTTVTAAATTTASAQSLAAPGTSPVPPQNISAPANTIQPLSPNPVQQTDSTAPIPVTSTTSSSMGAWPSPTNVPDNSDWDLILKGYTATPMPKNRGLPILDPELTPSPARIPIQYGSSSSMAQVVPTSPTGAEMPVSPSTSISPSALFHTGRESIIGASPAEETESMPSFFKWRESSEDRRSTERHTVKSASSSARIIENSLIAATANTNTNGNNNNINASSNQSNGAHEHRRVKSFMATIESLDLPAASAPPIPTQPTHLTQPPTMQTQQMIQPAQLVIDGRPRDSILLIPAFPEPPATLHNRRISHMEPRYRPKNNRANNLSQLSEHGRTSSFSSDDSGSRGGSIPRSPTNPPSGGVSPQQTGSGAPAANLGLTARGSYTPITSSEDVPQAQTSNCIYSAARNGDLMELQQFLNDALHQSITNGSSSGSGRAPMNRRQSSMQHLSNTAAILDEFEPIERLPVLCCAAVARKNKYQALNMVVRAGANVEGKEPRGGNTPLHLVCETAPPPVLDASNQRYRQDELNGGGDGGVGLVDPKLSQLSLLDLEPANPEDEKDDDEDQEAALKRVNEQDDQEQEALLRVKEDSESVFSLSTNDGGVFLSAHPQAPPGGAYYQMKNQVLMKGGLEDQIRLLVLAGSPIDTPNLRGETPLLLLLRYHDSVTALATLLRLGADPTHMAPFGPGTMPPVEVIMDPSMPLTTDAQRKRASKGLKRSTNTLSTRRIGGSSKNPLVQQQLLQQKSGEDPNHILVMHGAALAHAAYYLQLDSMRYLLEHEIECSDPVQIEQAIVACQQSVAAQVNPPLVALQNRILLILERNWTGEAGRRNRIRVAERTLNRKRKPVRSSPLLSALAVASAPAPSPAPSQGSMTYVHNGSTYSYSSPTSPAHDRLSPASSFNTIATTGTTSTTAANRPSFYGGKTSSQSLGAIPTTHLYAVEGPSGPEIELISQHGFPAASGQNQQQPAYQPLSRFQERPMQLPLATQPKTAAGSLPEFWMPDGPGPKAGHDGDGQESPDGGKNFFRKFRAMGKKTH